MPVLHPPAPPNPQNTKMKKRTGNTPIFTNRRLSNDQLRAFSAIRLGGLIWNGVQWQVIAGIEQAPRVVRFSYRCVDGLFARQLASPVMNPRIDGPDRKRFVRAGFTGLGASIICELNDLCVGCGCTYEHACRGGCSWVSELWCSSCDELWAKHT